MDESSTAVNESVVADTTATDSAPVEITSSEVAEDEFDGLGDVDLSNPSAPEVEEEVPEAKPETVEVEEAKPETEAQPQSKAEERKQQLNNEIRDLVSLRNAYREEVARQNAEAYQPATEEELLEQINPETNENYNRLEAKLAAIEQQREIERYNNEIAEAQLTLSSEASRALNDFPMFDPKLDGQGKPTNPEYIENIEIVNQVDQFLGANLVFDQNTNQIIGSNVSPYQLYKTIADATRHATTRGQVSAQKATEKMLANADTTSNVPTKGSADPMDDIFNRIKDVKFSE